MRLVVGLGNPGRSYSGNRHNFGFMTAGVIARRHSFSSPKEKFQGELAEGEIGGERTLILWPTTFMNESGQSVSAAAKFHKITNEDIFVLHDELDLPLGKIRVKRGGGAGGHNGLRSLDAHIGNDYWRIRLGIGHPGIKELVRHWVLQDFTKAEIARAALVSAAIADNLPTLFQEGDSSFMNKTALQLGRSLQESPIASPKQS